MKNSYLTVSDHFCGAGGSGQGVRRVAERRGGLEIKVALNHWKLATDTYASNFKNTLIDCTDISACDPRRYPSTDIAIMTPECTTHTPAGGNCHKTLKAQMDLFEKNIIDPATERSRATMWDVPRFAEYHKYNAIIIENVVEAKTRWPLFETWLKAMHILGYKHKTIYLNSQHCHPTPQSRDRMYVVFWRKGNNAPNLKHTPKSHCPRCNKDIQAVQTWKDPSKKFGKYRTQYLYRCPTDGTIVEPYYHAAFNVIDWADRGTRIGDRKKPLAEKTMTRIKYGDKKYRDFPFMIKLEHSGGNLETNIRPAYEPLQTQTTTQGMAFAVPPFIVENNGKSFTRPVTDRLPTMTTKNKHGIINPDCWDAFISYYHGTSQASHFTEPLYTARTGDCYQLITHTGSQELNDYYYRMLKPQEVKLAMAFDRDYIILGNKEDQVKQCGNAVTPPAMEFLVDRVCETFN